MLSMGMDFHFDTETHDIIKNEEVVLNIKGLRGIILEVLLTASRDVYLSKEELIESVWGKSSFVVGVNSLTQQVYLLRKSLKKIGFHNYILSRTRVGYKISKRTVFYNGKHHVKNSLTFLSLC